MKKDEDAPLAVVVVRNEGSVCAMHRQPKREGERKKIMVNIACE